jgi:hypothetical protein
MNSTSSFNRKILHRIRLIVSVVLITSCAGCALRTQTTAAAVARFAAATKAYGPLPGAPIQIYGTITRNERELVQTRETFTGEAVAARVRENLEKIRTTEKSFNTASKQADSALAVLNTYADCLTTLASDKPIDALDQSSKDFGSSLDKAIKQYNQTFGSKLGLIGSVAAGIIRGAGGIYIRHEQAVALQKFVSEADAKVIPRLTRDVRSLLLDHIKPDIDELRQRLDYDFDLAATSGSQHLPFETIHAIDDWYSSLDQAKSVADQAAKSATTYREAHSKLAAAVNKKLDLAEVLEEIRTLQAEIQAGQKLAAGATKK